MTGRIVFSAIAVVSVLSGGSLARAEKAPDNTPDSGIDVASGEWKADKLIVQRSGPRDSKITETIELKDKGKSLEIDTKLESSGTDMPSREFKRVYDRVTPS